MLHDIAMLNIAARAVLDHIAMRNVAIAILAVLAIGSVGDAADVPAVEIHATCGRDVVLDAATRDAHVRALRSVLADGLRTSQRTGTGRYGVDAAIAKLDVTPTRGYLEVRAEIHVVLSDDHARIQWVGTSSATVRESGYRQAHVRAMQREAVEHATRELVHPVRSHLIAAAARPSS